METRFGSRFNADSSKITENEMKAIVTGGLGFIGSNLCRKLVDIWKDWQVLVIDDLSSGKECNKIKHVEYVIKSIVQPGLMNEIVGTYKPDVIFHFAALPRVSYSVEYPLKTTEVNLIGTMAILEAVRLHNKNTRIVYSSSSSVYGGAEVLPTPIGHPCDPQSPYAMQKYQSELWCKMYANLYDLDVVSLRYFNAFGPHSYYGGAYSTVLSAWLYFLYVDQSIPAFLEGDGTQTRDFCFIDNIVEANVLAAESDRIFCGETLNIAQGTAYSLLDCKDLLERISGKELKLEQRPPRIGDVKHTLADISESRKFLSYNPTVDFPGQVQCMANWYRDKYVR